MQDGRERERQKATRREKEMVMIEKSWMPNHGQNRQKIRLKEDEWMQTEGVVCEIKKGKEDKDFKWRSN